MKNRWIVKQKGVTLIELLVALAIFAIVIGAIYRLFIGQTKAYNVQDQVVEVQQSVRSAMELLLRDLRMTGYDDDSLTSTVTVTTPLTPVASNSIVVSYEYQNQIYSIAYWTDASLRLWRQVTIGVAAQPADPLLENVEELTFTYGLDDNWDGAVDDRNGDNTIDENDFVPAGSVGSSKAVAIRVTLTARPTTDNPDVQKVISDRKLTSAVGLRNLILR